MIKIFQEEEEKINNSSFCDYGNQNLYGEELDEDREEDLDAAFVEMTASIERQEDEDNIYNYSNDEINM